MEMSRKYLGFHTIIDFYDCNEEVLNDVNKVREIMLNALKMADIPFLEDKFHEFTPQGLTGVIFLRESHFSVHTWPEHRFAALDLFTCGENLDLSKAYTYLKNEFGAQRMSLFRVERGVLSEINS